MKHNIELSKQLLITVKHKKRRRIFLVNQDFKKNTPFNSLQETGTTYSGLISVNVAGALVLKKHEAADFMMLASTIL